MRTTTPSTMARTFVPKGALKVGCGFGLSWPVEVFAPGITYPNSDSGRSVPPSFDLINLISPAIPVAALYGARLRPRCLISRSGLLGSVATAVFVVVLVLDVAVFVVD